MIKLLYIADPMCSWCYGFGPELQGFLHTLPDFRLDIMVGGLRAYNTETMDDATRSMILSHWKKVHDASALPFDFDGLNTPGFIYDTEPACRAVVAARTLAEDMPSMAILAVFHAIQHAFYAQAQDITDLTVLASVATHALNQYDNSASFDEASFLETLNSPMTINETRQDFVQTQTWGISGFPALLLVKEDGLHMLSAGYTKTANLCTAFSSIT
jgi:putative protein-disulfide isomerase